MRCFICRFQISTWYQFDGQEDKEWYCYDCLKKQYKKLGIEK